MGKRAISHRFDVFDRILIKKRFLLIERIFLLLFCKSVNLIQKIVRVLAVVRMNSSHFPMQKLTPFKSGSHFVRNSKVTWREIKRVRRVRLLTKQQKMNIIKRSVK